MFPWDEKGTLGTKRINFLIISLIFFLIDLIQNFNENIFFNECLLDFALSYLYQCVHIS